ncbi:MAG: hypothetical protein GWN84_14265 [Gammaproteobacteria bacterium]|nr:hypothetical protein [Gammaproteobacteria bacterium]NIR83964.1 hypothetical protein [Gammaproteobacteria bacterium]NIR89108.1 hypothetical protein [Gammaproteobacteria bacterium]NIU04910.1 hypothetical protein [Gammaproteobacteria bacterium]NIV52076.1 hypothetical protein [Gammaproteobacteria bacterium]
MAVFLQIIGWLLLIGSGLLWLDAVAAVVANPDPSVMHQMLVALLGVMFLLSLVVIGISVIIHRLTLLNEDLSPGRAHTTTIQ